MHIEFRIENTNAAAVFKGHIERRLRFALGRFGGRVGRVTVRISGNTRREKECRISTELLPFGRVAVRETDPDLFAALDRAIRRAGRLFGSEIDRLDSLVFSAYTMHP